MGNLYLFSSTYHHKSVSLSCSKLSSSELVPEALESDSLCSSLYGPGIEESEVLALLESSVSLELLVSALSEADIVSKPLNPNSFESQERLNF